MVKERNSRRRQSASRRENDRKEGSRSPAVVLGALVVLGQSELMEQRRRREGRDWQGGRGRNGSADGQDTGHGGGRIERSAACESGGREDGDVELGGWTVVRGGPGDAEVGALV